MGTDFLRKTVWHEIAPFDCSRIQGKASAEPQGGFVRKTVHHAVEPFDCSKSIAKPLEVCTITMDIPGGLSNDEIELLLSNLVRQLDDLHRSKGGNGLRVGDLRVTSQESSASPSSRQGRITVRVPLASNGASPGPQRSAG